MNKFVDKSIFTEFVIKRNFFKISYSLQLQGCNQDSVVTKLYIASTNPEMYA